MKKGGKFLFIKVLLILVLVVIWAGLILYEQLPSLLRPSLAEKINNFYLAHPYSLEVLSTLKIILILLIPLTILVIFLKIYVFGNKKEIAGINLPVIKSRTKTDLDTLFAIVQEKKELKISSIAKLFRIDDDLAMEWAKILEAGDLVTIEYPGFGGSIVRIKLPKEEEGKEEIKKENKIESPIQDRKIIKKIEKKKKKEVKVLAKKRKKEEKRSNRLQKRKNKR